MTTLINEAKLWRIQIDFVANIPIIISNNLPQLYQAKCIVAELATTHFKKNVL